MYLDESNEYWDGKTVKVIYDLEYSGNLKNALGKECAIWEIAAVSGTHHFHVLINPYLTRKVVPLPVHERYAMPTKEEFQKQGALSFVEGMKLFIVFLQSLLKKDDQKLILMSHNGFRGDKIVLENEIIRHHLQQDVMMLPIFFFDTLYYVRNCLPKFESYSISNLYQQLFQKEIENLHTAETDVNALREILEYINKPIVGAVFMFFLTPFSNVRGIGLALEKRFFVAGFTSLEHFYYLIGINISNINNALIQHRILYPGKIYQLNSITMELYNYGLMKMLL
jgi:hypothetical protein